MKKTSFLLMLFMTIVMMAVAPQSAWAAGTKPTSGSGTTGDPYIITSEANLIWFRDAVNGTNTGTGTGTNICAKLNADITLTSDWTPIGTTSKKYNGTFNGNKKTIKGLSGSHGLFAYTTGTAPSNTSSTENIAIIKDLTLEGSISASTDNIGSFVEHAEGSTRLYRVESKVNITITGAKTHIGGIMGGYNRTEGEQLRLNGCTYSGTMNVGSSTDSNGGIIGFCEKDANVEIRHCFFAGSITSSGSNPTIGGILGYARDDDGGTQNFSYLQNCFCSGSIKGSGTSNMGIFVGYPNGSNVVNNITDNTYVVNSNSSSGIKMLGHSQTAAASNKAITISVKANNANYGTVSTSYVNPTADANTLLQVSAKAYNNCIFSGWSDSKESTHTVELTSDVSLTARFVKKTEKAVLLDGILTFYFDTITHSQGTSYELKYSECPAFSNNTSITKVVFDSSFSNFRPNYCNKWFYRCSNLTSIEGISNLNTANVTNMSEMFEGCSRLSSLDLSSFNTTVVTNMSGMFANCNWLKTLTLSTEFSTAQVTNMSGMFEDCSSLSSLDLSKFNTANVTNMSRMFYGCSSLSSLDLSKFNTAQVTNMSSMFYGCSSLSSLDLSKFNTAKVTDMSRMFEGCSRMETLTLSTNFNTAKVQTMGHMFNRCIKLKSIDLSNFNTGTVNQMACMFYGCSSLSSLDLSKFNTANVTNMSAMFYGCSSLSSLDLSKFNTAAVKDMSQMFNGCTILSSLNLSKFNTAAVKDMSQMFKDCKNLSSLNLSKFNTANVTDMSNMFYHSNIKELTISNFDMQKATNTSVMFYDATIDALTLKSLPFLADKTFNSYFTKASGKTVKCLLDETSTIFSGTNYLPVITECNHYFNTTGATTDATCTEAKKTQHSCQVCKQVYYVAEGNALGHDFSSQTTVETYKKDTATCTEAATYYYKCSRCEQKDTTYYTSTEEKDKALGHTHTPHTAIDPTCTTIGYKDYWSCDRCNKLFSDEACTTETTIADMTIPALGHDFSSQTTTSRYKKSDATCTEAATYYYKCSHCEQKDTNYYTSTEEKDKALGHHIIKVDAVEATCTTGNTDYWKCIRCNKLFSNEEGSAETTLENVTIAATRTHSYSDESETLCSSCDHSWIYITGGDWAIQRFGAEAFDVSYDTETKQGVIEFSSKLTSIVDWAFESCGDLQSIVLPSSVTSIGIGAFEYCVNLQSIILPSGVTSIGDGAFYNCSELDSISFNSIPSIGSSTFYNCGKLFTRTLSLTDGSYVYEHSVENSDFYDPLVHEWSYPTLTEAPTYTRTGIKNQWGTLVVPFAVDYDNSKPYDLYTLSSVEGDAISLTKVTYTLRAGTPVLIRMSEAARNAETGKYDLTLSAADNSVSTTLNTASSVNDLTLTGAYSITDITGKNGYIIANNMFWSIQDVKGENNVYCAPFRAYLEAYGDDLAPQLRIGSTEEDDETFILEVLNDINSDETELFDMNGRHIDDLQSGTNIVKRGNRTFKVIIK